MLLASSEIYNGDNGTFTKIIPASSGSMRRDYPAGLNSSVVSFGRLETSNRADDVIPENSKVSQPQSPTQSK
jgi:hypothetical protein